MTKPLSRIAAEEIVAALEKEAARLSGDDQPIDLLRVPEVEAIISKHFPAERGDGWVRCEERLPKLGECVLIAVNDTDVVVERNRSWCVPIFTGMLTDTGWWSYGAHCGGGPTKDSVTHWRPFPPGPGK